MKIGTCTCGAEFKGTTEEEVMTQMGEHAASAHADSEEYKSMMAMGPDEQKAAMKGMIRDEVSS